jgi:hypothetical protein
MSIDDVTQLAWQCKKHGAAKSPAFGLGNVFDSPREDAVIQEISFVTKCRARRWEQIDRDLTFLSASTAPQDRRHKDAMLQSGLQHA